MEGEGGGGNGLGEGLRVVEARARREEGSVLKKFECDEEGDPTIDCIYNRQNSSVFINDKE